MAIYCMLSTIGPEGWRTIAENPNRIRMVNEEVEAMGFTIIGQYSLMGRYDFLTIIEAGDDANLARLALNLASRGTMKTETIPAIEIEKYISTLLSPPV